MKIQNKINIVVLGSGGREHALSWKIKQSPLVQEVYTMPGNGGIPSSVPIDYMDFASVRTWCELNDVRVIIVGPEVPLSEGIVEYFQGSGIRVFGPSKTGALLESSKSFAKEFMIRHGVATAGYKKLTAPYSLEDIDEAIAAFSGKVVIKYDGLAAGKGVIVCEDAKHAVESAAKLRAVYGNAATLIFEERLTGPELSYIGITDGRSIQLFQPAQDHKRLLDTDLGPNTGGMGAYTPVAIATAELNEKVYQEIIQPTLLGLQTDNIDYKGFIYFGVLVQNGQPYLLEYNARMGDPETEVLLPSLQNDLLEAILLCLDGRANEIEFTFNPGHFLDVVLVAGGYPEAYEKNIPIYGLSSVPENVVLFHAGTKIDEHQIVTNGGRVLNVIGRGATFEQAREAAYQACEMIDFKNMFYRKDIGFKNL